MRVEIGNRRIESPRQKNGPSAKQGGFSLFEVLISVGILAIIASVSSLTWTGYQRKQAVVAGAREFVNVLREAQGNAIGRVGGGSWGIRVVNTGTGLGPPYAVLFKGADWASGTSVRRSTLSSRVDLVSPPEADLLDLFFEPRTGKLLNPSDKCPDITAPLNCSEIVILGLSGGEMRTITVWEHGGMEIK